MRVALITGALGFVGRSLTDKLLSRGYRVVAVDCIDESLVKKRENVEYIQSDLSSLDAFSSLKSECSLMYHLAWAGVNPEARVDIQTQKKNIDLCISAVELARALSIKRLVFLGSTMEYCYNELPICESSRPTPSNAYGSVKVATRFIAEELCSRYGIDFEYAVITSIYGPGREDNNVIFYSIKKLLSGESPELSACVQKWDFVHIDDATDALLLIGEHGAPGAFYAVGTGENKALREYIDVISSLIENSPPVKFGAVQYKDGKIASSAINLSRLTKDTGYMPKYSFEKGIKEVIDFYRSKI